ncbi:hypothetical protein [Streptomyces sp. ICBB 8177]|uniref:hypothetical protein n=1 Tax=Streptomyces sp. ICBB 8177 TaxID=563922 RepID=UPI000D674116|nr:hypothetical protein [Streptomyces sp. ICBB 8177]PWI45045.1 hypothetical protein CK485_07700 [Streptomyces sp. ICBB 8177]
MEPRELWSRHQVLAEAFCRSDEHVKDAQSLLDKARADRLRLLAGFSVSVGSDGAVAAMLGLAEREVRVARRTVGKSEARQAADELLNTAPTASQTGAANDSPCSPVPQPSELMPPASDSLSSVPTDAQQQPPATTTPSQAVAAEPVTIEEAGQPGQTIGWSPALDTVLVNSWHAEVDLETLSAQFGMDLTHIVKRVQQLFAQGLLAPPTGDSLKTGRHRRAGHTIGIEAEPVCYGRQSGGAVHDEAAWPGEWRHPASQGWDGVLTAWTDGTSPSLSTIPHQEPWPQT